MKTEDQMKDAIGRLIFVKDNSDISHDQMMTLWGMIEGIMWCMNVPGKAKTLQRIIEGEFEEGITFEEAMKRKQRATNVPPRG